jgi:hypothetical protein
MRAWQALGFSALAATVAMALSIGCDVKQPPSTTYFDEQIEPVLFSTCARSSTASGCHVADARGDALGNLDVTSFTNVNKRRDLLTRYGPYLQSGLLLKVLPPEMIQVQTWDGQTVQVTTDVRHTGGPILDPNGTAYYALRHWIDDGATESGMPAPVAPAGTGPCGTAVPGNDGYDLSTDPTTPDFSDFQQNVVPVLKQSCAMGSCHGSQNNVLYFACGDTPEQLRYDYYKASDYLAPVANQSEIVRRPLAPMAGGAFHEGGVVFTATSDAGYQALLEWATQHGPPSTAGLGPGFDFFAHRIQPVLVRKGCMQMQCHSGASFHDYRLRGGTTGAFSFSATKQNYNMTVGMLALESDDPAASRLVRKNLIRPELGGDGIVHRGGPLFEDFQGTPASGALCDAQNYDYDNGDLNTIPALCMIREWMKRERANRPPIAPLSGIVYVKRPLSNNPDRVQDFDVYTPGADLRLVDATIAAGSITLGTDRSLMAGCGLDPNVADVRRPAVSWDGSRIAFAVRSSAGEPLRIYEAAADGTSCGPLAGLTAQKTTDNGLLVHDFDPAYGPPDANGVEPIVFASTRGNLDDSAYDYTGAQRTPADPTKPNADLYVYESDPAAPGQMRVRQLTFLLNTERMPAFMRDGRVVFAVEKRTPGFAQIGLRRINLDGGDYHPLYAQRGSIGYRSVSQVVTLSDGDFAAIFADDGVPHHAGALGIFNRTIGIDFHSTDASDYVTDPDVLDPSSMHARDPAFFLHSLLMPDPGATGHLGSVTGVYRSPSPLPNGELLVSWGAASDAASFGGDFDVWVVNPSLGTRTLLFGTAGQAEVDAVAIYGKPPRKIYASAAGQPNAYGMDESVKTADVTIHDMPMLASIFLQNTPTGREVEDLPSMEIWEMLPPPPGADSFSSAAAAPFVTSDSYGQLIVRKRLLGTVPFNSDGSIHYVIPGGMPFGIHLPDTDLSTQRGLPRWVNEQFMLTPGEKLHEEFPRAFFNGFCGNCHGSVTGSQLDVAQRPDLMSNASSTEAFGQTPLDLNKPPSQRGPIVGP